MAKRNPRTGTKPANVKPESKPAWPMERHSGEGSASAMETLQKLETRRRLASRPAPADEPGKGS